MMATRVHSAAAILVILYALSTAACSTLDTEDYCRYSQDRSPGSVDAGSLALVIGVKPDRVRRTPFVVFRNLAEDSPKSFVRLSAIPAPHVLPAGLDESRCARVDWSTYDLVVDATEWQAFWQDGNASQVKIGIAFLEDHGPLPLGGFGAAIVDTDTASALVSCGCYWK